jgi:hypothetical protein
MLQPALIQLMQRHICELKATKEWLMLDSIDYITECLEACRSAEMLADLREIFPRDTLKGASIKVSQTQREIIQEWLQHLNTMH